MNMTDVRYHTFNVANLFLKLYLAWGRKSSATLDL